MTAPVKFNEFPGVTFPAELIAIGLHDQSWHNDAFAKCTRELKGDRHLCVYVAEDNADEREIPGAPKYSVCIYQDDFTDPNWPIGEGDDLRNIVAMCQAVIFADNAEDPSFREHCLTAITEEYGEDSQIEALNKVGEFCEHVLSAKDWKTFEDYAHKALDYEMVRAACILLSTKGTAGVKL